MSFDELLVKPANADDFEFYYLLKCEPVSIKWSGFKSAPDKAKLHSWFMQKVECIDVKDSYRLYIIFALNDGILLRVGYLAIYVLNSYANCCEIGIGVSTDYMNKGLGKKAVRIAVDECKNLGYRKVFAYILRDNLRSCATFLKAGFVPTNNIKLESIEIMNKDVEMCEYEYKENVNVVYD